MKKVILSLCVAAVVGVGLFGLFVYRKAAPSSADHRLLTLVSGSETVSSVTLNLRLLKSARSVESLKDHLEPAERYLLKAGDIQLRHRDLFLETFSSASWGFMKTAKGAAPFRVFASHGPADQALEVLAGAHLVEPAAGEDFVLIHPDTCERVGPLRLVKGKRVLAFVPAELAASVSERLAQAPAQEMDSLLIATANVNVEPFLQEVAFPIVKAFAMEVELADKARRLALSLRADKSGKLWAELDVATGHTKELQALWEAKMGGDSKVQALVQEAVTHAPSSDGFRLTFDVNALQKNKAARSWALFSSDESKPLTDEDVKAITEEERLLEAQDVYPYAEALTPESFFALSGEDCEASEGLLLGDAKKLSIAFESLSAHPELPGTDFVQLSAHACLPPHYVPLLGARPLLEVAIQRPEVDRQFCGWLAGEEDGMSSKETFDGSAFTERHRARNEVQFTFKPGVDTQKLAAIEGSVTVHIPTRVQKHRLAFAPPYGRTELAVPGGRLFVEGTGAGPEGLRFRLVGEGDHPTVLAVRALNPDGKYLDTEVQPASDGFFKLPFPDLVPDVKERSFFAHGKPAWLEVVVVEASTPLTQFFTLEPPFPAGHAQEESEDAAGDPRTVTALTQASYESTFLAPDSVARREAEFTEYLEMNRDDQVGNRIRTDSPFKLSLRMEGMFEGNLTILWAEDVGAAFKQMDTPLELEIQEVDFVDGTRLRAEDIEEVEEVESEKRYVWGDRFGRKATWRTSLSLRHSNGGANAFTLILFDDYVPARLEDVPVARVKGQLSFSLPEVVAMSSPAPLSLHARSGAGESRFRIVSIQKGGVSIRSENTDEPGYSALFTDAAGRPADVSLRERQDFQGEVFQLDFDTRGPISQWRMLQAKGGSKTYTYPFEIVAHKLKPASRSRQARK